MGLGSLILGRKYKFIVKCINLNRELCKRRLLQKMTKVTLIEWKYDIHSTNTAKQFTMLRLHITLITATHEVPLETYNLTCCQRK